MSNKIKLFTKFGLLSLVVVFLGAGCNPFANSPKENLTEMRKKMAEVNAVKYQANATIKGFNQSSNKSNKKAEMNQMFSGVLSEADKFNIELSGESSLKNYSKPKSKLDISASVPSSNQKIKLNLRQIDNVNYLNVASLGPLQSSPMVAMFGSKLIGNWIKLPEGQTKNDKMKNKELTKKQISKIKSLFKNTNFVTVQENLGEETVNGKSTYHYRVKANKSEVNNFDKKMKEITGRKDKKENQIMAKNMKQLGDKKFDIWIGTDDKRLYKLSVKDLSAKGENRESTVDLTLNLSDYNNEINVEEPENVKSFGELMGGMFGSGGTGAENSKNGNSGLFPSGGSDSSAKGKVELNLNKDGANTEGNMNIKSKILNQKK
jgi:hypothetical protein